MAMLIDTGFLYATLDPSDKHHARVVGFLRTLTDEEELILPTPTLVEITYFIATRLGHPEMRGFVRSLFRHQTPQLQLEPIQQSDIPRIHEILEQYADAEVDFVDAFLVTLAERLNISTILTVDQRDFRMIRPRHCDYFDIRP